MGYIADIAENALRLPPRERAELAVLLIDSLDEERDAGAEGAWDIEIARRIRELDSGAIQAIPWERARAMILGADKAS